jgi:hypothetical protein
MSTSTPEASDREKPPTGKVFAYHATLREFVASIAQNGLLAHYDENLGEDVIFVEPDEAESAIYLQDNGVMLRLTVNGIGSTPEGECVLWDTPKIDPQNIYIRNQQYWVHLPDVATS